MVWFNSEEKDKEKPVVEVPKPRVKDETMCVEEGCFEPKAPAQTYLCAKHCRSN